MMKRTLMKIADMLREEYKLRSYDYWVTLDLPDGFERTVDGKRVGVEIYRGQEDDQSLEIVLSVYGPGPISSRWHIIRTIVVPKRSAGR